MILLLLACAGPGSDTGAGPTAWIEPDVEGLRFAPVQRCDDPLPEVRWAEVGSEMGLQGNPEADYPHHHGGGAAVDDLDGDGDLDVVLSYPVGPPMIYLRGDDGFAAPAPAPAPAQGFLLGLADVDGDGDPDLLAGGYKTEPAVMLNDGAALFTPTALPALPQSAYRVREIAPGDVDGDGDVDLYLLANAGADDPAERADFLLLGDGAGGFALDEGAIPQALGAGRGFDAIWFDLDGDLDQDLYVVNDDGADFGGNVLYENVDGALIDVSAERAAGLVHFGMGVDAGDFDGDGLADLYLTAVEHNVLLQALPDGSFVDAAQARGADPLVEWFEMGWGAIWLDFDNDGDLDVLNAQGDRWAETSSADAWVSIEYEAPLDLLEQVDGAFTEVGADYGLAQVGSHRGLVAADHNGDGVLDLLATDVVGPPLLYLSEGCTSAGWLSVEGPPGARIAITAGGRTQTGWISTESGYGAAGPPITWFGLGEAAGVDRMVIDLPDGRSFTVDGFEGRRAIVVE